VVVAYATVAQFTEVYSLKDVSSAQVLTFLTRATVKVNEVLARAYAVPFGVDNASARELTIDVAALMYKIRTRDQRDSGELRTEVDGRFEALLEGRAQMVTDAGAVVTRSAGAVPWSTTENYRSAFDLREPYEQRFDPDQLDYLHNQDA